MNSEMWPLDVNGQYRMLMNHAASGVKVPGRNGVVYQNEEPTRIPSFFSSHPFTTVRYVSPKTVLAELCWMVGGLCNNVGYLHDKGVRIWDKWADPETGDLGPIYGMQWAHEFQTDMRALQNAPRERRYSRRWLYNAWNAKQLPEMALPPCHFAFQLVFVPAKDAPDLDVLHMHVFQRSSDVVVGFPYNAAYYGLLCRLLAGLFPGVAAGNVFFHISNPHMYATHYAEVFRNGLHLSPVSNVVHDTPLTWLPPLTGASDNVEILWNFDELWKRWKGTDWFKRYDLVPKIPFEAVE